MDPFPLLMIIEESIKTIHLFFLEMTDFITAILFETSACVPYLQFSYLVPRVDISYITKKQVIYVFFA